MIPSIGKQKIAYKDHRDISFESLDFYINLSQKIICKLGPTFFTGLSKEMLSNEDAISFIANAIMMGDWRWTKQEEDRDKKHKNLYSYRNQCAIWAIKTYITKKYKQAHSTNPSCLNHEYENLSLLDMVADKKQRPPLEMIIETENNEVSTNLLRRLFDSDIISEKQKRHIKMYYLEEQTLEKIGKEYNVTREAIRQSIKTAISKIRALV